MEKSIVFTTNNVFCLQMMQTAAVLLLLREEKIPQTVSLRDLDVLGWKNGKDQRSFSLRVLDRCTSKPSGYRFFNFSILS